MTERRERRYFLASELRRLLLEYGDLCDGPTLEALGLAASRSMIVVESGTTFDWDEVAENMAKIQEHEKHG